MAAALQPGNTVSFQQHRSHPVGVRPRPALSMRRPVTSHKRSERSMVRAGSDHDGHAFLHDFCMSIPYGAGAATAGVVCCFLGAELIGTTSAAAGVMICLSSYLSLQAWKKGEKSTLYTLISAGCSAGVGYMMWQQVQQKVAVVPASVGLAASAALALFCVYNILAGGNPPKKQAKAA